MELPTKFLQDLLKSVLEDIGVDPNSRYEYEELADFLFSSDIYKVSVHTKNSINNFIIKVLRMGFEKLDCQLSFINEIMFYEFLMKALDEYQKLNLRETYKPFESVPKCFKTTNDSGLYAIVLEGINANEYVMLDRCEVLGFSELCLMMRQLGKFHALSLAMKDKDPDTFSNLKENSVTETVFFKKRLDEIFWGEYAYAARDVMRRMKTKQSLESEHIVKLEKLYNDRVAYSMADAIKPRQEDEQFSVFTHGDLWINNVLFCYRNGDNETSKTAEEMFFVDFQQCRYGSVALDVSAVLLLLTGREMRARHWDGALKVYHSSLSEFLVGMGSDPEELFPFSALEDQMRKYSVFNVGLALMFPYWMYNPVGKKADTACHDIADSAMFLAECCRNMSEQCFQRIVDVVKEAIDRGYL